MPPRVGSNGAVTKSHRNVTPRKSNVIDLTRDSSEETSDNSSGEEATEEKEFEDALKRHMRRPDGGRGYQTSSAGTQGRSSGAGQAAVGRKEPNKLLQVARRGQEHILEDSFIVTSLHHRPWGAGDDNATIGVFFTEREAKDAAYVHFRSIERSADGWESEWRRRPGDGMLQLYGYIEEGEEDSETYIASIKPYQQKRPVAVQPGVPSTPRPQPGASRRRYVYMVKEEQKFQLRSGQSPFHSPPSLICSEN